jgi:tetratricopeptide (TPR) repeat protein
MGEINMGKELSKTRLIIVIIAAAFSAIVIGVVAFTNSPAQKLRRQLDLGEKYLSELNYEQAVAAFKDALAIDPNSQEVLSGLKEAYTQWSDSLLVSEKYEEALKRLNEALSVLPEDASLSEKRVLVYLDWAEYYASSQDYENAIRIAEEGYETTQDKRLLDKISVYKEQKLLLEKKAERESYYEERKEIIDTFLSMMKDEDYDSLFDNVWDDEIVSRLEPYTEPLFIVNEEVELSPTGTGFGLYKAGNGRFCCYYGDLTEGKRTGNGIMFYTSVEYDGTSRSYRVFNGKWDNNMPNGHGVETRIHDELGKKKYGIKSVYAGDYVDGYENGDRQEDIYLIDGRHILFEFTCKDGVKEKIKVDGRLRIKDGRYYYAVDKNGSKTKGVFSEGDVFSVFMIKNWEKLE